MDAATSLVIDLGVRRQAWSAQLLTDTLDLRFSPELAHGRAWVALRGELGAVGMVHAPWAGGRPVPEQGFWGAYVGGEAGALRYGPHGLYGGVSTRGYRVSFIEGPSTEVRIPAPTPWLLAELVGGLYRDRGHVWMRLGVQHDALGEALQPHAHLTATASPGGELGAVTELRAGVAQGQSFLTRTRVGGMNPYVVPVSGAGWGEWWAETYAIGRVGPRLSVDKSGHVFTHRLVVDGGVADDRTVASQSDLAMVWGLGSLNRWTHDRWFADLDLGWGAGVPRDRSAPPLSAWFAIGQSWD